MDIVKIFKALGDENRIKIISLLGSNEVCACSLLENLCISQSTLSHHMKILADAGVVSVRKEGRWMYYKISQNIIPVLERFIGQLSRCDNNSICQC